MNKFKNVKVGDTVLIEVSASYGWGKAKTFLVSDEVIKVTQTQFTVKSGYRYKKDGRMIGEILNMAYNVGDSCGFIGDSKATDQTNEFKAFKDKIAMESSFNSKVEEIKLPINSDYDNDTLKELHRRINAISTLLES